MPTLSCHPGILCRDAFIPLLWYAKSNQGVAGYTRLVATKVSFEPDDVNFSQPSHWVRAHLDNRTYPCWLGVNRQWIASHVACRVRNGDTGTMSTWHAMLNR
mmetsp:Transcript_9283/g.56528  ORF Transcript_9283/g.56528 Transcript_9283/m.56528 type:complete len:102 (-) Transcript_9283:674-979(-)